MAIVLNDQFGLGLQFVDLSLNFLQSPDIHLSSLHSLYSMSGAPMTTAFEPTSAIEAVAKATLPTIKNDPIAKAVYNNILGNIPKKERVTVFCNICSLEFSSKTVYDTHIAGSKHQKKVKSRELMENLEKTETGFEKDSASGVIRCKICDITVNSPKLLATHVAGNKHKTNKKKMTEDHSTEPTPAKRHCPGLGITGTANGVNGERTGVEPNAQQQQTTIEMPPEKTKKMEIKPNRLGLDFKVPNCVAKIKDTKNGGEFLCNTCQAHCNSDVQLFQHINSKKHSDKVNGITSFKRGKRGGIGSAPNARGGASIPLPNAGRGAPNWGSRGSAPQTRGRGRGGRPGAPRRGTGVSRGSFHPVSRGFAAQKRPNAFAASYTEETSYDDSYKITDTSYNMTSYTVAEPPAPPSRPSFPTGYKRMNRPARGPSRRGRFARGARTPRQPRPAITTGEEHHDFSSQDYFPSRSQTSRPPSQYRGGRLTTSRAAHSYQPDYSYESSYRYENRPEEYNHVPSMGNSFTYTEPLSQNFVSGGSMM